MKRYVKPMMDAQMFVANEYVSVCYYIKCNYAPGYGPAGSTNMWGGDKPYHALNPNGSGCGHEENQAITVLSGDINNGATISITELNVDAYGGGSERKAYFVDSEGATTGRKETLSGVKVGKEIYWVTNVGYWMPHKGIVTYSDSNRPNHS